ncbi:non-ribosomal peptide synthetase [Symbioplanes lichenis]|uniref:non-ribosomal peptide synthetase n=1 Tax=Symbioplanes lichenis TaxID=1629072 RepID=UPI002739A740|nr:non-ribosomal peptide synthetase [Actinoplanes lichenis]
MTALLRALEDQARRRPDAPAVVVGDDHVSYGRLMERARQLAGRLVAAGVRPGDVACLRLRQSAGTVVAMVAAMRAGAAWAVVEPDRPESHLAALVRDTGCRVLVHDGEPDAAPGSGLTPVDLRHHAGSPTGPLPDALPEDLPAYVVHTSGSTGRPKGVVVGHAHLAASIACRDALYGRRPPVFVVLLRLSFDGSLGATLWTLTRGGTVVLPGEARLPDAEHAARLVADHRGTHLECVPSHYRLVLDHAAALPDSLVHVSVGGERCTGDLVERHYRLLPRTTLVNEYGPTEAIVSCLSHPTVPGDPAAPVPIGSPLPGATAYVLDAALREVATGTVGELYVGGPFTAHGYAGQPGLTAQRFVADPFAARPGARLYRTGDLASRRPDATLDFHGRVDDQVKIRGQRVEPGEVALVLREHPAVRDAAVLVEEEPEPALVAYVVCDGPPPATSLRLLCRRRVSAAATPARFVAVAALPLTAGGKLDRAALARLGATSAATPARPRDDPDWTPVQRAVADEWAEVLGHRDWDRETNFFDAGGTSLKIVQLHQRLERRWPGALRLGALFDLATVAAQAGAVSAQPGVVAAQAGAVPAQAGGVAAPEDRPGPGGHRAAPVLSFEI